MVSLISDLIRYQAISIAGSVCLALLYLKIRSSRENKFSVQVSHYCALLAEAVAKSVVQGIPLDEQLRRFCTSREIDRKAYPYAIAKVAQSLSGNERKGISSHYAEMGFFQRDIERLTRSKWHRKLEAIAFLEIICEPKSAPYLLRAIQDPHPSVSTAAILAFTKICSIEFAMELLSNPPQQILDKVELIDEVIENVASNHGLPLLEQGLNDAFFWSPKHHHWVMSYVYWIGKLGVVQLSGRLAAIAEMGATRPLAAPLLMAILQSMKELGDPSSISIFDRFLTHADSEVRAQAIIGRASFCSDRERVEFFDKHMNDPAPEVQLSLHMLRKGGLT